jgi:acyl-CoA synthetase (AMP-forming)/AMP-acid ligase II
VQTIADPLEHARLTAAHKEAVVCGQDRLDYEAVWSRCRRLAGHLASLGLQRGDRVAIVAQNCHRYLEAYLAIPSAGYIIVPLNARSTIPELEYSARDSQARVLLTDRAPSALDSFFEHVVRLPDGYEQAIADAEPADLGVDIDENDLAGIFYTGGTTGKAKGVMLTHRNLMANTWTALSWAHLTHNDRWLIMAPLFHAAGTCSVLATVWVTGTQVIVPSTNPSDVLDMIEHERVTVTLAVPTLLAAITDEQFARPRDMSTLRLMSHGASPVATEILRRAAKAFPEAELLHLYGTTETSPIATNLPHEELLLGTPEARSCGYPALGVQVQVRSLEGAALPPGEVGEVVIRGANVTVGYWKKPEETAAALRDGWYHTGDLGYLDEHCRLYLVDRLKDMVVTGGENVYTVEVEDALYSHPGVAEAAVFGVPDARWGESLYAVVVPRTEVTSEELVEYCRERISGFKIPKHIDVRAEPLPKSGAGKVLKRELREPFWAEHETRIGN